MTTIYKEGEKPKELHLETCKHPDGFLYMKDYLNNDKETVYWIYCPHCWQKTLHLCDQPENVSGDRILKSLKKMIEDAKKNKT